jgi:hypothetical protein
MVERDGQETLPLWIRALAESELPEEIKRQQEAIARHVMLDTPRDPDSLMLRHARVEVELATPQEEDRLVQSYITLGEFDKALQVATKPENILEVNRYKHAVNRPDNELDDCQNQLVTLPGGDFGEISRFQFKRRIYSKKHGKVMNVLYCHKCSFLNVTDVVPTDLKTQLDGRRGADKDSDVFRGSSEVAKERGRKK